MFELIIPLALTALEEVLFTVAVIPLNVPLILESVTLVACVVVVC